MTHIPQLDETDCGAAYLVMVALHHKSQHRLTSIRETAGTDPQVGRLGTEPYRQHRPDPPQQELLETDGAETMELRLLPHTHEIFLKPGEAVRNRSEMRESVKA
jgi:hypothetical protein